MLGNQNLMNQTNNIERNNLERGQGQNIAVVTRGGLMRNSEPQNLYSSVNPTDDQAGAMASSPESSSNNISTRNDQRGQGYQSSIETERDIYDGVVLHAEDDRDAALEFIRNMEMENPELNINIAIYENLQPGTSVFELATKLLDSCRYLFVFVTKNFVSAKVEQFILENAMYKTLNFEKQISRIIPVKTDETDLPLLSILKSLEYDNYLEAKKSQGPDQVFIKCFRDLITNGRKQYLVVGDYRQENLKATETKLTKDPQSPMMGTSDDIKVDKELLSKGTFISYDNCVYLAGACNVGKSTLASILIGEEISQQWKSTDGLTIYFGRNGIDLKNKKMVPLKQDFGGDVLSKVLRGKPDMTQEKPDTTLSKNREEVLPHDSNKGNIIPETHTVTQRTDITLSTSTVPGTGKDDAITTIQEYVKEEIRKGTYKMEIAPSDLVDFGGQRSFDMTHQLFMRRKGTFVLMFNGRIDFLVPLKEYEQGETTESILKHWVNSILSYCADDEDFLPIIMFCATHSDDFNQEDRIDRKAKLIHDLRELFKNHKRKHRIIYDDIFFINGKDKNDLEIKQLKSKLVEVAFKQKSWGKRVPMAWVPLDLQMSKMRRVHNVSIISKEELTTLNQRNGDLALPVKEITNFLNVQHSLGKILYIDQHGLDNFIVVQPQSLVNILRSFITAEHFWPKDEKLRGILCTLTNTGKIARQDLLKLWSQEKFHQHMPSDNLKEFIIQVLVHLDILVEPRHYRQEKESKVLSYLVPCVVKRRLPPFTDFYVKSADKMICLSYILLKSSIPAALSFKLIGAAINVWPLKKTQEGICLYHQAAILCIDGSNELHLLVKDDKVFVYLINKVAKCFVSPNIASTVQECLTLTMTKVLEFYHKSFGKSLSTLDVSKAFEIEVGEWCTSEGGCYISVPELEEKTEWRCKNNKTHDKTYPRYWICNKKQVECDEKCPGLDEKDLMLPPEDKHLFRLAKLIKLAECYNLVIKLGLSDTTWNDIQDTDRYDNTVKKYVALCKWKDLKYKQMTKLSFKELSDALAEDYHTHFLCQLFREDVTVYGIANSALQEIPEEDVLQDLSKEVGNCAIHLGVELGLSMATIEGILFESPKSMFKQTFGVMKEWKSSSKVETTILMLMKAFQSADGRGLMFLRKKYIEGSSPVRGTKRKLEEGEDD